MADSFSFEFSDGVTDSVPCSYIEFAERTVLPQYKDMPEKEVRNLFLLPRIFFLKKNVCCLFVILYIAIRVMYCMFLQSCFVTNNLCGEHAKIKEYHRREGFEVGNADKIFESTSMDQLTRRTG